MLRASADAAGVNFDITSIADRARPSGRDDVDALFAFTEALVGRTGRLEQARDALNELLGPGAVVAASGSAGNFEMMNRILDATGVPVPQAMRDRIGPMIGLES